MLLDTLVAIIGVFMGGSILLQLKRCINRQHSDDVSTGMIYVLIGGTISWLVYGLEHQLPTVIVANSVGLVCDLATLFVVYYFRRPRPSPSTAHTDEAPAAARAMRLAKTRR